MAIFTLNLGYTGTQGIGSRRCQLVCDDSLDAVETSGYIPSSYNVQPTDIFDTWYGENSASYAVFLTSRAIDGTITLSTSTEPGNVNLPVVSGNIAFFQGTSGTIGDLGISPTNPSLTKVASIATGSYGAYTVGNIIVAHDTSGSLIGGVGTQATQVNFPSGPAIGTTIAFTAGNLFGGTAITSGTGYGLRGQVSASGMGGAVLSGINGLGAFSGVSTGGGEYSAIKGELSIGTLAIQSNDLVAPFISDLGESSDNPSGSLINMCNFIGINRTTATAGSYMNFFGAATNLMILNQNDVPGYLTSAGTATPSGTARQIKIEADGLAFYVLGYTNPYT